MANTMAVKRMMYNDHGQVHARITAGSALYILTLLLDAGVTPTSVRDGICDLEDAKLITMMGAYLHDIGNAVHRELHHLHGCYMAAKILDRILPALYGDLDLRTQVRQEVLHCIFSHDESVRCLSVEAGVVKVAVVLPELMLNTAKLAKDYYHLSVLGSCKPYSLRALNRFKPRS